VKGKSKDFVNEPLTVVLPFRNEELNQGLILTRVNSSKLNSQDHWMLIDDGSRTPWQPELPEFASLHCLDDEGGSKKLALQYAVLRSETPIILTTDADCQNQANWILSMRQACTASTNIVVGPVLMQPEKSFVSQIAAMESLALLSVTMGTAGLNIPLMCSGANLLFRKSAWQDVGGYSDHINQPSGDDVLLMHSIWLRNPKSVDAQVNPDALVFTEAPQSWKDFLHQRKRWASKSTKYKNKAVVFIGVLVWLFNLLIVLLSVLGFFNPFYCYLFLAITRNRPLIPIIRHFFFYTSNFLYLDFTSLNLYEIFIVNFLNNENKRRGFLNWP
jgi:cellulose synthase/poly-beta-1,6-N-acetylglucosamine synthase-like glycosyltransferase